MMQWANTFPLYSPPGYGGVLFDLKANEGDLRALFLDVSASYGYLTSLDDYGASLVSPGRTSSLGSIALGEGIRTACCFFHRS